MVVLCEGGGWGVGQLHIISRAAAGGRAFVYSSDCLSPAASSELFGIPSLCVWYSLTQCMHSDSVWCCCVYMVCCGTVPHAWSFCQQTLSALIKESCLGEGRKGDKWWCPYGLVSRHSMQLSWKVTLTIWEDRVRGWGGGGGMMTFLGEGEEEEE